MYSPSSRLRSFPIAALAVLAGCSTTFDSEGGLGSTPMVAAELSTFLDEHPFAAGEARDHKVTPILLLPADQISNPDVPALRSWWGDFAGEAQGFFGYATAGHTFAIAPLEVIESPLSLAEMRELDFDPVALVGNLKGARPAAANEIFWVMTLGAGARFHTTQEVGGIALVGESVHFGHLVEVTGEIEHCEHILEPRAVDSCRVHDSRLEQSAGSAIHELGHLFGLGHEDDHAGVVPTQAIMMHKARYGDVRSATAAPGGVSDDYRLRLIDSDFFYRTTLAAPVGGGGGDDDVCLVIPRGDDGDACSSEGQWRCAVSPARANGEVSQKCAGGAWVDQMLDPADCCACGPSSGAACQGSAIDDGGGDPPPPPPPPPAPTSCCRPNDAAVDNFCHLPPGTSGCGMTATGGYCDPNGDMSYTDGDWVRGYNEYHSVCL